MKTSLLSISVITTLLLVGCDYDKDNTSYEEPTTVIDKKEPTIVVANTVSQLQSASRNVQYLISGSNGLSLYEFDKDTTLDASNCSSVDGDDGVVDNQSCLDRWPIYITPDSAKAGDFNLVTESSAKTGNFEQHKAQATFKHHPLYYWFKDTKIGDITGDKIKNVWHLVYPNNDFVSSVVDTKLSSDYRAQEYLTSETSRALYTFDKDDVNMSNCYDECAKIWPPYTAELDKSVLPKGLDATKLSSIERSDGIMQVTYDSQPLYYYQMDTKDTDTNGDWVKGVWHLIELGSSTVETPKEALKSGSRDVNYLISSDTNSALNEFALYEFDKDTELFESKCSIEDTADGVEDNQSCIDRWPLYTAKGSASVATVVTPELGHENQSTYRGHPLYYWFKDAKKGDTTGDKIKNVWHLIYPNSDFDAQSEGVKLSDAQRTQTFLTAANSMSLYTFDKDTANVSNCYDACEAIWPVFDATIDTTNLPMGIEAKDFAKITRTDGTTQTTYKSQPLYYFAKDAKAGDTKGDWVKGVWHLIELGSSAKNDEVVAETVEVADVEAGKAKFANCAACHGATGKEKAFGISIVLADDIDTAAQAETLLRFLRNDGTGKNPTMVSIAKSLSEKELRDVSAYIETLN